MQPFTLPTHKLPVHISWQICEDRLMPETRFPDVPVLFVPELLEEVGLPAEFFDKYPRTLGGGERQLISVARALATDPDLIILDEPTSALDVSIQAKVISKLIELQKEKNLAYLFITHDLSLMRNVADRVAILYLGRLCEQAPAADFFEKPLHPYTQMLLSSIPVATADEEEMKPVKILSEGEIPSPVNVPPGCAFHMRCRDRLPICDKEQPCMKEVSPGHLVCCHLFDDMEDLGLKQSGTVEASI